MTADRQSISGGIALRRPFDRDGEMFGVGFVLADFVAPGVSNESIVEAFYRFQLTDTIQLTPDVQLVIDPALGDQDVVAVFGIRLQATF